MSQILSSPVGLQGSVLSPVAPLCHMVDPCGVEGGVCLLAVGLSVRCVRPAGVAVFGLMNPTGIIDWICRMFGITWLGGRWGGGFRNLTVCK